MISKTLYCPVGDHAEIGYLVKGTRSSYICKECQFVFTWDEKGKLLPPVKLDTRKKKTCGCLGCQGRDESKYYKMGDPR